MSIVIIHIVFILLSVTCFSQDGDTVDCNWVTALKAENVSVFIKGKEGKQDIKWKFFFKKFSLELSDNSYQIISFNITWFSNRKSSLILRKNLGSLVEPDLQDETIENKENFSLSTIEPGVLIAFDSILIEKDGVCYKAKPFIANTILR